MSPTGDPEPRINRRQLDSELRDLENELLHISQSIPGMARRIASIRSRLAIPAQTEMELETPVPKEPDAGTTD